MYLYCTVGELSQRMQIPGNVWVDVWHSARPVCTCIVL